MRHEHLLCRVCRKLTAERQSVPGSALPSPLVPPAPQRPYTFVHMWLSCLHRLLFTEFSPNLVCAEKSRLFPASGFVSIFPLSLAPLLWCFEIKRNGFSPAIAPHHHHRRRWSHRSYNGPVFLRSVTPGGDSTFMYVPPHVQSKLQRPRWVSIFWGGSTASRIHTWEGDLSSCAAQRFSPKGFPSSIERSGMSAGPPSNRRSSERRVKPKRF